MAQTKRKPAAAKPAAQADTNTAEETGAAAGSAAAPPDANPKPEEAATPPQAASGNGSEDRGDDDQGGDHAPGFALYVRTHGKKPRRRSGIAFGPEAVLVTDAAFSRDIDGAKALLAILDDPQLQCFQIDEDGNELPLCGELDLDVLRAAIASGVIAGSQPESDA
jgi:hypothetical protein